MSNKQEWTIEGNSSKKQKKLFSTPIILTKIIRYVNYKACPKVEQRGFARTDFKIQMILSTNFSVVRLYARKGQRRQLITRNVMRERTFSSSLCVMRSRKNRI